MSARVGLLDYGMGNLFSVVQACRAVGLEPSLATDPEAVRACDALIVPGVGAFGDAMASLTQGGLDQAVRELVRQGKPYLGLCLGLQLLFESSQEFGGHAGLSILPGRVERLPAATARAARVRVPQIGWNSIQPVDQPWEGSPLREVRPGEHVWFVHSYTARPERRSDWLCTTDYDGAEVCSGVQRENVVGFQFHPEKSGPTGLRVLAGWAAGLRREGVS